MLWVNLIMDSLASLALATEPPRDELLDRPPHGREEYIISRKMIKHLVIMAIWQSAVIFVISLSGSYWIPDNTHIGKVAINPLDSTLLHPGQLYYQNGDDLYK
jgi:magnesium-transporting ATPase (P-type)